MAKAFDQYPGGIPSDLFVATKGGMVRTKNAENSAAAWMTGLIDCWLSCWNSSK